MCRFHGYMPARLRSEVDAAIGVDSFFAARVLTMPAREVVQRQPKRKGRVDCQQRFPRQLGVESRLQTPGSEPIVDDVCHGGGDGRVPQAATRRLRPLASSKHPLVQQRPSRGHEVVDEKTSQCMTQIRGTTVRCLSPKQPLTGSIQGAGRRTPLQLAGHGHDQRREETGRGTGDQCLSRGAFPRVHANLDTACCDAFRPLIREYCQ
jgi:hypothetical protein